MSIKNLIGNKESQTMEFKSKVSDNIGKDICAFVNISRRGSGKNTYYVLSDEYRTNKYE